jgi:hypothetical protein
VGDPVYRRNRYGTGSGDLLDLVINGYEHDWVAADPDANGCSRSHTYTFSGTPATTEWTTLRVLDSWNGDNSGVLSVAIYRVDCEDPAQCIPPRPNPPLPGFPPQPPVPLPTIPPPLPTLPPVTTPTVPGPTVPTPTVPTVPTIPPGPTIPTVPPVTTPPPPATVPPLPSTTIPPPSPTTSSPPSGADSPLFSSSVSETLTVDTSNPAGTTSKQMYQAGRTYDFYVSGRYRYGAGSAMADAECSQAPGDTTYQPARYGTRKLDLTLNGYEFAWTPTGPDPCDPSGTYRLTIAADGTGLVNFKVDDDVYSDNSGSLVVTVVTRPLAVAVPNPGVGATLIDTMLLDSRDSLGSFTSRPLLPGHRYAFVATGQWEWGGGTADSECSVSPSDPVGNDYGPNLELSINLLDVFWQPVTYLSNPGACSRDLHTYQWQVVPTGSGGYPLLRVRDDGGYLDNGGMLAVFVYEIG